MDKQSIKSMNLYSQVDRIYNDLHAQGIDDESPLEVETLTPFDQYHYFGTEAVDEAIEMAGINGASKVLDVGSGLGGPARYLADKVGCHVTALELQSDLNEVATSLTERCGLAGQVEHLCGDVLTWEAPQSGYDRLMSFLAFYHIADTATLMTQCAKALEPGGRIYVEDLFSLGDFTDDQEHELRHMLYGQSLPRREAYISNLETAGFTDIVFTDMTAAWTDFCGGRVKQFRANQGKFESVHGAAVFNALDEFYSSVMMLFDSGNMGGVRLTAIRA